MLKLIVIFACSSVLIANGLSVGRKPSAAQRDSERETELKSPEGIPSHQLHQAPKESLPNQQLPQSELAVNIRDSNSNLKKDFSLSAIFSRLAAFYEAPEGIHQTQIYFRGTDHSPSVTHLFAQLAFSNSPPDQFASGKKIVKIGMEIGGQVRGLFLVVVRY